MYGQVGAILFSIIAMLSGARSYRQIHTLIDRRLAILNAAFPQTALRRNRRPTRRCAASCNGSIRPNWSGRSDAMRKGSINPAPPLRRGSSRSTGRRCGRSFDAFADRKAAHVLSAFAVDHQIILAHEVVDEKSNEIPAVQTLIATLGLSGRVFTLDAMHCQKNLRDRPRHRQ